jgi:hypothetical protein
MTIGSNITRAHVFDLVKFAKWALFVRLFRNEGIGPNILKTHVC